MAIYLTSPDKHVIGRCEIKIEEPSIQRVYWTNEAGEEIDKLIPQSKAILRIETRAWNPKIKLEIELTHKSGEPITTKLKDIKEVSVNKEGIATQEYKWTTEDSVYVKISTSAKLTENSPVLEKKWGIWIEDDTNTDMHYFDPSIGYSGTSQFVKDFYEAYFYLIQSKTANNIFHSFSMKRNDVYIEFLITKPFSDDRNRFEENKKMNKLDNQYVGTVKWHPRKGLSFPISKEEKNIKVSMSASIALLHELGHAVEINLHGLNYLKKCKASSSPEKGYPDLAEYYATTKYEHVVIDELNLLGIKEGKRPYYDYITPGHIKEMTSSVSLTVLK